MEAGSAPWYETRAAAASRRIALRRRALPTLTDRYALFLGGVLIGYGLLGKGFAYVGVPPLFVGEIALVLGLIAALLSGAMIASLATLPAFLLVLLMGWTLLRTVPFVEPYGMDALRDSVVTMYGGFSLIVVALLLHSPRRVEEGVAFYRKYVVIYVLVAPVMYLISKYAYDYTPRWSSNVSIPEIRNGEIAVHLTGITLFAVAGFHRLKPAAVAIVAATLLISFASGRGAMLAFIVPCLLAMIVLGQGRRLIAICLAGVTLFAVALTIETAFLEQKEPGHSVERRVSARQLAANAISIFEKSDEQTEGTKRWRLDWWNAIIDNTIRGPQFWTGRGFGINLADADGFTDGDHADLPPLRSPHSVHMTILARAGVPGLVLWLALLATWLASMGRSMLIAKARGDDAWMRLFLVVTCYAMAMVINASFDVALEGPMQGIWFWCLIGFGIGAEMVYRCGRARSHAGA